MTNNTPTAIGQEAVQTKGWLRAHKWLLLRRLTQTLILGLFLAGPLADVWIVKGNMASSLTLDVLPLSDPYVLLQGLLAGNVPQSTALIGVAIVLAVYMLLAGRVYCSWVCPINPITDLSAWLRQRLGLKGGFAFTRNARLWMLAMTLAVAAATGTIAWELLNPVSMVYRGLIFGMGMAWAVVLAIFAFDLFASRRGWCGHLCPVGMFYGLLGRLAITRVSAQARHRCDDCMDCFAVCPEPHVISGPLKGGEKTNSTGPLILSGDCTNCGRCIDVCAENVFSFTTRFNQKETPPSNYRSEDDPLHHDSKGEIRPAA